MHTFSLFWSRTRCVLLVCGVFVTLALSACGTDEEAEQREREAERRAQVERERRARELKRARETAEETQQAFEGCEEALGPFVEALGEMDSRLDIGLSYDDYTDQVGDLKVEYDKIDFSALTEEDFACTSGVRLPAERAINEYSKAAAKWGDCFDAFDCDLDSIDPTLQRHWGRATRSVERARDGLSDLERDAEKATKELEEAEAAAQATETATTEGS